MKMKGTSTTKPKMKDGKVQPPKKSSRLMKAEQAVGKFEEMRNDLLEMNQSFEKTFPKACAALQAIHHQEDECREQIGACKILVRDAKQSVGEFTCTHKATSEGYVGLKLLELIAKMPTKGAGEMLKELFQRGVIADVKVDKAAAKVVRASDPELRDRLSPAWDKGGDPLTPAIGTPKI